MFLGQTLDFPFPQFRLKPRLLVCEQIRKTHQSCLLKLWFWVPPTNVAFFGHLVEDGGGSETLAILISLRHGRRRHWSQWWRWLTWQTSHNMIAGGGVAGIWDGMLKVRYTIYNCFNIYVVGYAVLYMIWLGVLEKAWSTSIDLCVFPLVIRYWWE